MRLCTNDNVTVYEVTAETLPDLYEKIADGLRSLDLSYASTHTYYDGDAYFATLYVH